MSIAQPPHRPSTQRYAMGLRYHGHGFVGWARQRGLASIQGAVEAALSQVANHPIAVHCAGRTDRGVHATAQVIHFDSHAIRLDDNWVRGTQSHLPTDIGIHWVHAVPSAFHARHSAVFRRYQYVIYRKRLLAPGMATRVSHEHRDLDVAAMQAAAAHLIGEHDFNALRGADCQSRSSHRCVTHLTLHNQGPYLIVDVQANAFLLHMVRNIVGSLLAVGRGERSPDWMAAVLQSTDRRQAGVTAPPNGLYLVQVGYSAEMGLPYHPGPQAPWFLASNT